MRQLGQGRHRAEQLSEVLPWSSPDPPYPPWSSQYRGWREAAGLCQLGNPAWEATFDRVVPQVGHAGLRRCAGLPGHGRH